MGAGDFFWLAHHRNPLVGSEFLSVGGLGGGVRCHSLSKPSLYTFGRLPHVDAAFGQSTIAGEDPSINTFVMQGQLHIIM
jgi:hypothetical protein